MPFDPYYPDIPLDTDDPSDSQGLILSNFSTLNQQFSIDHIPLTDSTNNGFHTKISYVPGGVPGDLDAIPRVYCKIISYPDLPNPPTSRSELFFK